MTLRGAGPGGPLSGVEKAYVSKWVVFACSCMIQACAGLSYRCARVAAPGERRACVLVRACDPAAAACRRRCRVCVQLQRIGLQQACATK